jgi:hypothetical protein
VKEDLQPIDREKLGRRMMCPDISKMRWREVYGPGSAQCDGCTAHCGIGAPHGQPLREFVKPLKQADLIL